MIKAIITGVATVVAALVGYFLSDGFRERLAQKQRDRIAAEVARGDEAAVNARLGRFRSVVPWVVIASHHRRLRGHAHRLCEGTGQGDGPPHRRGLLQRD